MGKAKKIALDIYGMTFMDDYRIKASRGIIQYAREHTDWQILMNDSNVSLAHKFNEYEDLIALGAEGILFSPLDPAVTDRIHALGLHAVNYLGSMSDDRFFSVCQDDLAIGRLAAGHFLDQGLRNLAFCGPANWLWSGLRASAFGEEARKAGCECSFFMPEYRGNESYTSMVNPLPDMDWTEVDALRDWIVSLPKPVGIMGCDDQRASHVLEACRDLGLAVPQAIAIVGADNNPLICESSLPRLSSVDYDSIQIGYQAAAMLDKIISGKTPEEKHITIPPAGVAVRESSDIITYHNHEVARALTFINENFTRSISIDEIARAAGYSKGHLERCFRRILHCSVAEEIRRRRLQRAKVLLMDRTLTVEQVALQSGFRHGPHMTRLFAAQTGMAPGAWRKNTILSWAPFVHQ